MALHTELRPKNFDDLIGNEDLKKSLENFLKKENRPHTFLLSGNSGCGKTTVARILTKELGCSSLDLYEINASDNRGIDSARDIIEKANFKPTAGKVKCFIMDESHLLTREAQNCLLKILEEPPEYVYFFLCTTEPSKIIKTIQNRCQHFKVDTLDDVTIKRYLSKVVKQKEIDIERDLLVLIAEQAKGSTRKALTLLDKVSGIDDREKARKLILEDIADDQNPEVIKLCRLIADGGSWNKVSKIIKDLKEEPESVRRSILGYLGSCLLNNGSQEFFDKADCFRENYFDDGKTGLILSCYEAINL